MQIYRNKKSKGPSAVRCAGFPKLSTKGVTTGPLPKHTRQRAPAQTVEDQAMARRFDMQGISRRVAVGLRPRGGRGSHRALRKWKARDMAWMSVNRQRVADPA